MQNNRLRGILLIACIGFCFSAPAFGQEKEFGLRSIGNPDVQAQRVVVEVSTKGEAPDTITDTRAWLVQMTESDDAAAAANEEKPRAITVRPSTVTFDKFDPKKNPNGINVATLTIPRSRLGSLKVDGASWTVLFTDGHLLLTASQSDPAKSGLTQAKGRDDADLYGNFSFLTGVGTSPIWTIDVKGGYAARISTILRHSCTKGKKCWQDRTRAGLFVDVQTNTDPKAPVDRTQVDPDSIRAFLKFFDTKRVGHKIFSRYWELRPGGEFNRQDVTGNFVVGGKWQYLTLPFKKAPFDLSPAAGFELGKNYNKPSTLFSRPVDLSRYDAITRLTAGADANYYFFRTKIKDPDDPYVVTITGSWIARVPFSPEPFTVSEILPDSTGKPARQKVVTLRTNTRHNVRMDLNWNVTKLFGVKLGYKYGSLPPLFEFVNHQVTVGLVFKAKFAKWHSAAD